MDGPMPDPATLDTEGDDDVVKGIDQSLLKLELTRPGSPLTLSKRRPK